MERLWENHKASVIAVIALLVVIASSIVIVPETDQAVIIKTA
jgi:membrane protease subunit HflC